MLILNYMKLYMTLYEILNHTPNNMSGNKNQKGIYGIFFSVHMFAIVRSIAIIQTHPVNNSCICINILFIYITNYYNH